MGTPRKKEQQARGAGAGFGEGIQGLAPAQPRHDRDLARRAGRVAEEYLDKLTEGHEPFTEEETAFPTDENIRLAAQGLVTPRRVHQQNERMRRQIQKEEYFKEQAKLRLKPQRREDSDELPSFEGISEEDHERLMAEIEQEELAERAARLEFEDVE
jgi:hypothetical protein